MNISIGFFIASSVEMLPGVYWQEHGLHHIIFELDTHTLYTVTEYDFLLWGHITDNRAGEVHAAGNFVVF